MPYLTEISKPTLIITAKDDPFLGVTAEHSDVSADVVLLNTTYGGHIGFVDYDYQALTFDTGFIGRQVMGFFDKHFVGQPTKAGMP